MIVLFSRFLWLGFYAKSNLKGIFGGYFMQVPESDNVASSVLILCLVESVLPESTIKWYNTLLSLDATCGRRVYLSPGSKVAFLKRKVVSGRSDKS